MKYAIIGAGGTGGILGFYMTKAGRDVTLIARGRHLAAMQEKGLAVEKMWDGTTETIPVKATDMEHYDEQPDVVLVCVKGYSLEETIPFIQRVAKPSTPCSDRGLRRYAYATICPSTPWRTPHGL